LDRLRQRLSVASQATATLRELAVRTAPGKIERDAAIQRFEYSFEATWMSAQRFLTVVEGVEAGSPKSAIRAYHEAGLLSAAQAEQALAMADDRNLTAHTYNEGLAETIFKRLSGHLAVLEAWLTAMKTRLPAKP
jgi:nucleotidyltransferase substrate binding protein (TIGR01987 family)